MAQRSSGGFAVAVFIAASLVARRAWAPPLCSYGSKVGGDVLTLKLRLATVDGAQVSVPVASYSLRSGCEPTALDGVLADPDAADGKRSVTWTLMRSQP